MSEIDKIQEEYYEQQTNFVKKSEKIMNRVMISDCVIKNLPVPITYLDSEDLSICLDNICNNCKNRSEFKLMNRYYCYKHINKELIKTNILKS